MAISYDMGPDEYNDAPGLRASDLVYAAQFSWAHLRARPVRPDSDTMRLGRLHHAMIENPEAAAARFRTDAPTNPATGRVWGRDTQKMAAWLATLPPGVEYADPSEVREARMVAEVVRSHPEAAKLLDGARHEVSLFGSIEGVQCKARVDIFHPNRWADIKTTTRAATGFQREAPHRGYWLQAAFHARVIEAATGCRPSHTAWIVVEQAPPHGVVVYEAAIEQVMALDATVSRMVREYAACVASGSWPGYPQTAQMIDCPPFVIPSVDQEEVYW